MQMNFESSGDSHHNNNNNNNNNNGGGHFNESDFSGNLETMHPNEELKPLSSLSMEFPSSGGNINSNSHSHNNNNNSSGSNNTSSSGSSGGLYHPEPYFSSLPGGGYVAPYGHIPPPSRSPSLPSTGLGGYESMTPPLPGTGYNNYDFSSYHMYPMGNSGSTSSVPDSSYNSIPSAPLPYLSQNFQEPSPYDNSAYNGWQTRPPSALVWNDHYPGSVNPSYHQYVPHHTYGYHQSNATSIARPYNPSIVGGGTAHNSSNSGNSNNNNNNTNNISGSSSSNSNSNNGLTGVEHFEQYDGLMTPPGILSGSDVTDLLIPSVRPISSGNNNNNNNNNNNTKNESSSSANARNARSSGGNFSPPPQLNNSLLAPSNVEICKLCAPGSDKLVGHAGRHKKPKDVEEMTMTNFSPAALRLNTQSPDYQSFMQSSMNILPASPTESYENYGSSPILQSFRFGGSSSSLPDLTPNPTGLPMMSYLKTFAGNSNSNNNNSSSSGGGGFLNRSNEAKNYNLSQIPSSRNSSSSSFLSTTGGMLSSSSSNSSFRRKAKSSSRSKSNSSDPEDLYIQSRRASSKSKKRAASLEPLSSMDSSRKAPRILRHIKTKSPRLGIASAWKQDYHDVLQSLDKSVLEYVTQELHQILHGELWKSIPAAIDVELNVSEYLQLQEQKVKDGEVLLYRKILPHRHKDPHQSCIACAVRAMYNKCLEINKERESNNADPSVAAALAAATATSEQVLDTSGLLDHEETSNAADEKVENKEIPDDDDDGGGDIKSHAVDTLVEKDALPSPKPDDQVEKGEKKLEESNNSPQDRARELIMNCIGIPSNMRVFYDASLVRLVPLKSEMQQY